MKPGGMIGGGILGEGVDGCIVTKPLWPCAAGKTSYGKEQGGFSDDVVSKIVKHGDVESIYLEAASRILGEEDAIKYLAGIRGHCRPANDAHPPSQTKIPDYVESKKALIKYVGSEGMACGHLKDDLLSEKGISKTHTLMYISRYPITLYEWTNLIKKRGVQMRLVMTSINISMPDFLSILQRFYKGRTEHLINIDLHHNNIFVRAQGSNIQFGIADFGRCILRQLNEPLSLPTYISEYLNTNQIRYSIYTGYKQVPFEARLLDFCFKKNLENQDPSVIVNEWLNDINNIDYAEMPYCNDIIVLNMKIYVKYLLTKPLFIDMVEELIEISKKMRYPSTLVRSLTRDELTVLEFITTRYMAMSPIVTILDQLHNIDSRIKFEIKEITAKRFSSNKTLDLKGQGSGVYYMVEYLNRLLIAPYTGRGSSLSAALSSVRSIDLPTLWTDIVSGH
jgi:hypothetical protein